MRKSQTALPEMYFSPGRSRKGEKKAEEGEGIPTEILGPGLQRAKDLQELLVMGGQVALENNVGYHGWGVAYGMVSRAPCTPPHDPCCLLRSAISPEALCGLVFFSLARDGGGGTQVGEVMETFRGTQSRAG